MGDFTVLNPEVDYHRNGVSGRGFYVVKFDTIDEGETEVSHMVAIMPDDPTWGECFVMDRDLLGAGNITFGQNSYRGDGFMPGVIEAVNADIKARDEKWGYTESELINCRPFWEE